MSCVYVVSNLQGTNLYTSKQQHSILCFVINHRVKSSAKALHLFHY